MKAITAARRAAILGLLRGDAAASYQWIGDYLEVEAREVWRVARAAGLERGMPVLEWLCAEADGCDGSDGFDGDAPEADGDGEVLGLDPAVEACAAQIRAGWSEEERQRRRRGETGDRD